MRRAKGPSHFEVLSPADGSAGGGSFGPTGEAEDAAGDSVKDASFFLLPIAVTGSTVSHGTAA